MKGKLGSPAKTRLLFLIVEKKIAKNEKAWTKDEKEWEKMKKAKYVESERIKRKILPLMNVAVPTRGE